MQAVVFIRGMKSSSWRWRTVWLAWWISGFSSVEHTEGGQPFAWRAFGQWTQGIPGCSCAASRTWQRLCFDQAVKVYRPWWLARQSPGDLCMSCTWKFPIATRWFKELINNWCSPISNRWLLRFHCESLAWIKTDFQTQKQILECTFERTLI